MALRSMLFGLGILLVIAFGFAPSSTAHAETDALGSGTIRTIDLARKLVTIKKGDGSSLTVKVKATTTILRNGKTAKLKALVLVDGINVKYNAGTNTARRINASGPASTRVSGRLTNAVKGSGTVTIGDQSFVATAGTRIARNGKLVSLSELTRQDRLTAHLASAANPAPQSSQALDILADGPEEGEVHGLITAINGSQVTVTPDNGTPDVTINVTATTMIEINGQDATLGDLGVNMEIEARYDPSTLDAFSIEADTDGEADDGHIQGVVAAVDVGAGKLTVTPNGGGAGVTLNVDSSTEIEVNDASAALADVQVGMPIEAEYDTATMLAREIKAGSGDDNQQDQELEGTVASIDTGASTITITPKSGPNVTLNVTPETEIEVNGEDATLADVQSSQSVRAEYDPATMNALELKVGNMDGED